MADSYYTMISKHSADIQAPWWRKFTRPTVHQASKAALIVVLVTTALYFLYLQRRHWEPDEEYLVLRAGSTTSTTGFPSSRARTVTTVASTSSSTSTGPPTTSVSADVAPEATCDNLVQLGREFEDEVGTKHWIPRFCELQHYDFTRSRPLISKCFSKSSKDTPSEILLIGDSRIRQIQHQINWLLIGKNNLGDTDHYNPHAVPGLCDPKQHIDSGRLERQQCNLTLKYPEHRLMNRLVWDPMLDSDQMLGVLSGLLRRPKEEVPDLIAINSGAWLLQHCDEHKLSSDYCVTQYTKVLMEIRPLLARLAEVTRVLWAPQTKVDRRFGKFGIFLSPSQNDAVGVFNKIAAGVLAGTKVMFWWSFAQTYDFFGDTHDGLHQGLRTVYTNTQVILNLVCNARFEMDAKVNYCCSTR